MNQTELTRTSLFEAHTFVDLDFNFKTYANKDVKLKSGENAVKQSVKNLLLLSKYDKPFDADIGSGLDSILFDPISPTAAVNLNIAIEDIINTYEPRIIIENIDVVADEDNHRYDITFEFSLANTETTKSIEFFLERLR